MKRELHILLVAVGAAVVFAGCNTCCHDVDRQSSASVETPLATAQPPPGPVRPGFPPIRINAGIGGVKDSAGRVWLEDAGFTGGDVIERPDLEIANTDQPEIYRSEHYMMDTFQWKLPNGKYQVKLHFCETYDGIFGPGERVFAFDVEGKAFKDFDVWAKAGGFAKACVETVDVEIKDGQLDITFTPDIENPQINGIEISSASQP